MGLHKEFSLRTSFCKLLYFLFGFFAYSSSATLSIMSAEKIVALYFPLQAKRICNVSIAKWVSIIAAFLSAAINLYLIIVVKVGISHSGFEKCTAADNGMLVMMYLDFIFYSFGPFLVMCVANILIIYKLLMLRYKNQSNQAINQGTNKSAMKGVGMLVSVSLTFIILTTPICLVFFDLVPSSETVKAIALVMFTLNHSINGFLYCLFGSKFRKELFKLICRCRQNRVEASTTGNNTMTNTVSPRY